MYPYINIGTLELPVYGLIIIISFTAGLFICSRFGRLYGIQPKYIICSGTFVAAGLLAGSKLLYLVTKLPDYIINYNIYSSYSYMDKLEFLVGGYVFYGGIIGATAGVIIFCNYFSFDKGSMLNILTPLIPFAHAFGRVGCFFGGCCYGIEYYGPLCVTFPGDVPRFPVQLTEALINLLLFIFLMAYTKKHTPVHGVTFGIYLICYSVIRFLLEFLRGDVIRGFLLGMSTSQWISLILFPIGIFIVKHAKKSK